MRKFFLAAGVAALAIAAPVAAERGGGGNKGGGGAAKVERGGGGGGGGGAARAERRGGGGGEARAARTERRGGGGGEARAARMERRGGGGGEARAARIERRGGGGQQARAARVERRGGGGQQARIDRRGGGDRRFAVMRAERGGGKAERGSGRAERTEIRGRGNANRGQARIERQRRNEQRVVQRERGRDRDRQQLRGRDRQEQRMVQRGRDRNQQQVLRGRDRQEQRVVMQGRDRDRDFARLRERDANIVQRLAWDDDDRWVQNFARGADGCPPGLAMKNPACMPPGQYRNMMGSLLPAAYASNYVPYDLRDLYYDTDDYYWRYGDGYLYRVDRDTRLVQSLLPLFGLGLGIGQPFPASYANHYVPSYYQPFYRDTSDDYYRYSNGYVYEIDRDTGLIEDIIPMYDNGYGVGQMLPASYSYYNVPYPYRSYYVDSPDHYYRYAPGAIYQVDRGTQLITAIAALLTGSNALTVGQPLPAGYSMYNVPYGYRDLYYDTPDSLYRYSNGSIYQVDPTTQLVTAVVSLLAGGMGIGQQFPYSYNSPDYYVPAHYQSFYPDTADDYYRYNAGYVYEIDRHSGLIEDVIPMYDNGYGVGQVLPASYSYYNVPDPYRSYYVEDDDYFYRYAPGAIYQVDRDSRQITSIASLLMDGNALSIGQPLPPGYSVYNVPYSYRDRYYDTPDAWYRYSNGHIYQVDPTTRLITAIIEAIV